MSKMQPRQIKKETTMKNFRYNRFLLLRYILAGFFFANVYWTLALLLSRSFFALLPICLLVLSLPAISEHLKLYGDKSEDMRHKLRKHLLYQYAQITVNIVTLIMTFFEFTFQLLYPFMTAKAQLLILLLLFVGVLLSVITIYRINAIYDNKDKHYGYIKEFAKMNK